jgi:hypothetical protein
MMAKKAADRYQSMDEVAGALQQWLVDHGLGGSSFSASAHSMGGSSVVGPRLTHTGAPSKRSDSNALRRAVAEAPAAESALADTVSSGEHSTTPSITRRKPDSRGLSDPNLKRVLPKAKPLDSSAPSSKTTKVSPVSLENAIDSDRLAMRGSRLSGEVKPLPKRRAKNVPSIWVWIAIGAVMLLGLVLLVLVISMPPHRPQSKASGSAAGTKSSPSASLDSAKNPSNP